MASSNQSTSSDTKIKLSLLNMNDLLKRELLYKNNEEQAKQQQAPTEEEAHNKPSRIECNICYKSINKVAFVCTEPCNKVFHLDCIERMLNEIKLSARQAYQVPIYRCCYCRRHLNLLQYSVEKFIHNLHQLKKEGYIVKNAIKQVIRNTELIEMGLLDAKDTFYYEITNKPIRLNTIKQPKRFLFNGNMHRATKLLVIQGNKHSRRQ